MHIILFFRFYTVYDINVQMSEGTFCRVEVQLWLTQHKHVNIYNTLSNMDECNQDDIYWRLIRLSLALSKYLPKLHTVCLFVELSN